MLWFVLLAAGMWILQGLLGLWQLRHFNQRFKLLRKEGRVVIGKSKGRVTAGVVLMFCLDQDCNIIRGEKMEGFSIFARLKPFNSFNHLKLLELEESKCNRLGKSVSKAVMNAIENYKAFINIAKSDMEVVGTENTRITV
ncbi:transcriptional regulator GutM [Pelosinus fermentans]|uniref:Glucitol operon transcriptional acivator GutM n=1 Tax=Pelosinus fermentans JBW45 TaxID=1192197 RepID=I9DG26_9FIRM|nr:transcriptional regulator GutM [Pelosinus fermentans]AJQ26732.1 glucitol operon transcriptional acivator GutM [Pelosinus fermentans JBW45]